MNTSEHDKRCNELFRKLDALKVQGADKVKGGEYDAVLAELSIATKQRLASIDLSVREVR